MRLPTKTEVEREQALERQAEVMEGLKIAKKVDVVRLELVKEQNNLEKFRKETTKLVQSEINDLFQKKQALIFENDVLERHNKNLKAPFDEEWENIRQTRVNELDERMGYLEKERISLKQEKADISVTQLQIEREKETIKITLEDATTRQSEALDKLKNADSILENAKIQANREQTRIDNENNNLSKRAEAVALEVRDIEVREEALKMSAKELASRQRFIDQKYENEIKDKTASLEKALQELEKEKSEVAYMKARVIEDKSLAEVQLEESISISTEAKKEKELAEKMLKDAQELQTGIYSKRETESEYFQKKSKELLSATKKAQAQEERILKLNKELLAQEKEIEKKNSELLEKTRKLENAIIESKRQNAHISAVQEKTEKAKIQAELALKEAVMKRKGADIELRTAKETLETAKKDELEARARIYAEEKELQKKER